MSAKGASSILIAAMLVFGIAIGLPLGLAGLTSAGGAQADCGVSAQGAREIPTRLIAIYQQAAARYGLGARGVAVLAAINKTETDFGRNLSTSPAGALGWMQFEPGTWATYGVDGDHNGRRDPNSPSDAIFAAARYLHASGAPGNWQSAIFSYNHAQWYVAQITRDADRYQGGGCADASGLRAHIVQIAQSQVGVTERPPGSNCTPYGPCESWCADFTTWVWRHAGVRGIGRIAFVPDLVTWGRAHGTWKPGAHNNPQPGDMVIFSGQRVALVEKVLPGGQITTINGNGSDGRVSHRGPADPSDYSALGPAPISGYVSPATGKALVA